MKRTALGLLVLGMFANFFWKWSPEWAQADVWNAVRSFYMIGLLGIFAAIYHTSRDMLLVCGYLSLLEAVTATTSFLWLIHPFEVLPGQDQGDAAFRVPLFVMGLFLGLMVLFAVRSHRDGKDTEP